MAFAVRSCLGGLRRWLGGARGLFMDRIAKEGLRYTNFHSTSLCSPTRAAIITGRNHHSAGFGVVGEVATGFPGYELNHPD